MKVLKSIPSVCIKKHAEARGLCDLDFDLLYLKGVGNRLALLQVSGSGTCVFSVLMLLKSHFLFQNLFFSPVLLVHYHLANTSLFNLRKFTLPDILDQIVSVDREIIQTHLHLSANCCIMRSKIVLLLYHDSKSICHHLD